MIANLGEAFRRVVVGQDAIFRGMTLGLLTGGHVLLEGLPGLAKTLSISTLARAIGANFSRIQFTPDLLPADIIGTMIYDPRTSAFTPKRGPLFANLVLADEINRAPAKVQSALLQAMQERAVTLGDTTHVLEEPFLVLATQNPIEQEGTYPLPEAQVDRFLFKVVVTYPTPQDERLIVSRALDGVGLDDVPCVLNTADVLSMRSLVRTVRVDERLRGYVVDLVNATRAPETVGSNTGRLIEFGASPRASIGLVLGARAQAFLGGRGFVTPSDIKSVAPDILRHRVLVSYEAEAEGVTSDQIVRDLLDRVPVPT